MENNEGFTFVDMDEFLKTITAPYKAISFRHSDREMFRNQLGAFFVEMAIELKNLHGAPLSELESFLEARIDTFIAIMDGERGF